MMQSSLSYVGINLGMPSSLLIHLSIARRCRSPLRMSGDLSPFCLNTIVKQQAFVSGTGFRFALEARRLGGPECEDIARRLDAVRVKAEALR